MRQGPAWVRWAIAAAVLALLGAAAWLTWQRTSARAPASPDAAAIVVRLAAQGAGDSATGAPTDTTRALAPKVDPDDPCGIRRFSEVDLDKDGPQLAALSQEAHDVMAQTIAGLQAQPGDAPRAAAALLALLRVSEAASPVPVALEGLRREGPDCDRSPDACRDATPAATDAQAAKSKQAQQTQQVLGKLVDMAVRTTDPWVYQLAATRCQSSDFSSHVPACQMISLRRWAQIDPDNAAPWLFMADEALRQKDAAALDEAIFRVAQARRSDLRFAKAVAVMQEQLPEGASPFIGFGMASALVGMDAAVGLPHYSVISQHCSVQAINDPSRREVCDAVTGLLIERSSTLLDLGVGISIAKRLGWPAARLAPHEALRDAVIAHQTEAMNGGSWTSSFGAQACRMLEAQNELLRDVGRHGELQVHRARVDATPLGRAGYAARLKTIQAEAASAAALAVSASASDRPNASAAASSR